MKALHLSTTLNHKLKYEKKKCMLINFVHSRILLLRRTCFICHDAKESFNIVQRNLRNLIYYEIIRINLRIIVTYL